MKRCDKSATAAFSVRLSGATEWREIDPARQVSPEERRLLRRSEGD